MERWAAGLLVIAAVGCSSSPLDPCTPPGGKSALAVTRASTVSGEQAAEAVVSTTAPSRPSAAPAGAEHRTSFFDYGDRLSALRRRERSRALDAAPGPGDPPIGTQWATLADSSPAAMCIKPAATSDLPPEGAPWAAAAPSKTTGDSPPLRIVNSKQIAFHYQVKGVGTSGLGSVDVWQTRDGSRWRRAPAQADEECIRVEIAEEGLHGFSLLAHNGDGLCDGPPIPGDAPQIWVLVDATNPVVDSLEATRGPRSDSRSVMVHWQAHDAYLEQFPIKLSFSEREGGPWKPIASHLDNRGAFVWHAPAALPSRLWVRIEATDLAGNVGEATTPVSTQ
jgi:hypothetical protein